MTPYSKELEKFCIMHVIWLLFVYLHSFIHIMIHSLFVNYYFNKTNIIHSLLLVYHSKWVRNQNFIIHSTIVVSLFNSMGTLLLTLDIMD